MAIFTPDDISASAIGERVGSVDGSGTTTVADIPVSLYSSIKVLNPTIYITGDLTAFADVQSFGAAFGRCYTRYSTDGGSSWTLMHYIDTGVLTSGDLTVVDSSTRNLSESGIFTLSDIQVEATGVGSVTYDTGIVIGRGTTLITNWYVDATPLALGMMIEA